MTDTVTLTFEVPAVLSFAKRNGASITMDTADIHPAVLSDIFQNGWTQKANDATSGLDAAGSQTAFDRVKEECFLGGQWVSRTPGVTSEEQARINGRRGAVLDWLKAGPTEEAVAAYKSYLAIDAKDQAARMAFRDAVWDTHGVSTVAPWIMSRVATL